MAVDPADPHGDEVAEDEDFPVEEVHQEGEVREIKNF